MTRQEIAGVRGARNDHEFHRLALLLYRGRNLLEEPFVLRRDEQPVNRAGVYAQDRFFAERTRRERYIRPGIAVLPARFGHLLSAITAPDDTHPVRVEARMRRQVRVGRDDIDFGVPDERASRLLAGDETAQVGTFTMAPQVEPQGCDAPGRQMPGEFAVGGTVAVGLIEHQDGGERFFGCGQAQVADEVPPLALNHDAGFFFGVGLGSSLVEQGTLAEKKKAAGYRAMVPCFEALQDLNDSVSGVTRVCCPEGYANAERGATAAGFIETPSPDITDSPDPLAPY